LPTASPTEPCVWPSTRAPCWRPPSPIAGSTSPSRISLTLTWSGRPPSWWPPRSPVQRNWSCGMMRTIRRW